MLPRLYLCEHRSAFGADAGMSPKLLLFRTRQHSVERVKQQSFELVALHTVIGFTWHHITCL